MQTMLTEVIEFISEGVVYQTADGQIKLWNKGAERIFGLTAEQVEGHTSFNHDWNLICEDLTPCSGDKHPSIITLTTGQALREQIRGLKRPQGEITWLSINTEPVFRPGQAKPHAVIVSFSDITARKQAEETLRQSELRVRALVEQAPDALYVQDIKGRILDVNQLACQMLGYSRQELLRLNLAQIDPDYTQREEQGAFWREFEKRSRAQFEARHRRRDGAIIPVEISLGPIQVGNQWLVLAFARDISERKSAQDNLRKSEKRYRQLFEAMISGFALHEIILDARGQPRDYRFLEVNPAFERLTGLKAEQVVGRTVLEVMPQIEPHWIETYGRVANTGESASFENYSHSLGKYYEVVAYSPTHGQFATIFHDITERKRNEEAQRIALFRQQAAVKAANVGLWEWDLATNKVHFSPEWKSQIGYREDEIGDDFEEWRSRVHPDDLEATLAKVQSSIAEGRQDHQAEFRFRHKDGSYRWILTHASVLTDENGRAERMLGSHLDVTERKQTEDIQRQAAEFLHGTLDSLSCNLAILDETATIVAVNAAWKKFGRENRLASSNYGVGSNYLEICRSAEGAWSQEAPLVAEAIVQALQGEKEEFYLEYPCHSPEEQRWFTLRLTRFLMHGQPRLVVAHENITHRRQAEEALRLSEDKFKRAFQVSPDAICITGASDGLFLEVNQGFLDLSGYSREEIRGKTSQDINVYQDPQARQKIMDILRAKGMVTNFETNFVAKDGTVFPGLLSAIVLTVDGAPSILSITRDIRDLRRAEGEREILEAQLRQAQKMEALGTLAGGIAHDFNNILGAVIGFAEMALDAAQSGQDNAQDLREILKAGQRAKSLVRQILSMSRRAEPRLKALDLNQEVRHAVGLLRRTIPKMISIETHLSESLPLVQADPTQLEQVILNLASNAQDAMPEGGKMIVETHQVALEQQYCDRHHEVQPGSYALLVLTDTGEGMDQKTREHIFEPFFTTKEVGKGTGLGLSSVYGIVKNHGGSIYCYSEPGLGTTFKIYLPLTKEQVAEPLAEEGHNGEDALAGHETILLVDDEEALRQFGARILEGKGYKILTASSGESALEIYQDPGRGVDLVVMDLGMPGMGGKKALKAILEFNPRAKVIIVSGYSANGQIEELLGSGAAGFVAKPFRRVELLSTVRSVLDHP